jgi:hypothetical protein
LNSVRRLEQGGSREEREKSLDIQNFGPLAIAGQKLSRSISV